MASGLSVGTMSANRPTPEQAKQADRHLAYAKSLLNDDGVEVMSYTHVPPTVKEAVTELKAALRLMGEIPRAPIVNSSIDCLSCASSLRDCFDLERTVLEAGPKPSGHVRCCDLCKHPFEYELSESGKWLPTLARYMPDHRGVSPEDEEDTAKATFESTKVSHPRQDATNTER